MNEWIPVGEKVPDLRQLVLGTGFIFGKPEQGRWYCVMYRATERSDIGWDATGIGPHTAPSHWMPLPDAPK